MKRPVIKCIFRNLYCKSNNCAKKETNSLVQLIIKEVLLFKQFLILKIQCTNSTIQMTFSNVPGLAAGGLKNNVMRLYLTIYKA